VIPPSSRGCSTTKQEECRVRAEDRDDDGEDQETSDGFQRDVVGLVVVSEPIWVCHQQRRRASERRQLTIPKVLRW
jgi:hypothetical protein